MKSMPLIGKSGKFRRAARRLIFELASSEARAAEVGGLDSSLEALSADCVAVLEATGGCCVVIVKREGGRRAEGEVR